MVTSPKKLHIQEYMNSAVKEAFSQIYACCNYSVLVSHQSKHVYLCDQNTRQFMPIVGKTPGNFHFKKIDSSYGT